MLPYHWLRLHRGLVLSAALIGVVALGATLSSRLASNVGLLLLSRSAVQSGVLEPAYPDTAQLASAQPWLQAATNIDASNKGAWRGLGFDLAMQGRDNEANAAWRAAGMMGQDFLQRGETERLAGNYREALAWYDRAEKVEPNLPSSVHYFRFLAQQSLGNADAAFDDLQQAILADQGWINPEIRFRAWYAWGVRLTDQQRPVEAERALQTAISAFPNDPRLYPILSETYRFLGLAQWAQDRLDEAVNSLRTAVQVNDQNVWAHIHFGMAVGLRQRATVPSLCR